MERLFEQEPDWVREGGMPELPAATSPVAPYVLVSVHEQRGEAVLCMGSAENCEDAAMAMKVMARPTERLEVRASMPELPADLKERLEIDAVNKAINTIRSERFRAYSMAKGDDYDREEFRARSDYVRDTPREHVTVTQMWQAALFKGEFYGFNLGAEERLRRYDVCAPEQQWFVVVPIVEFSENLGRRIVDFKLGVDDPEIFEGLFERYSNEVRCSVIYHSFHTSEEEAEAEGSRLNDSGAYWGVPVRIISGKIFTFWPRCDWESGSRMAISDPYLKNILSRSMTPAMMKQHITEAVNEANASSAALEPIPTPIDE